MAVREPVPDLLLVCVACAIPLIVGMLVRGIIGDWVAPVCLVILFFLLGAFASLRDWTMPVSLPFVRTSSLREIFLALALAVAIIAVSWFAGTAIGRAYSDLWGILSGLCIFGVLALAVSSWRNWQ
jgi:hypothetical protein